MLSISSCGFPLSVAMAVRKSASRWMKNVSAGNLKDAAVSPIVAPVSLGI
jgi:hypothetical protein